METQSDQLLRINSCGSWLQRLTGHCRQFVDSTGGIMATRVKVLLNFRISFIGFLYNQSAIATGISHIELLEMKTTTPSLDC